LTSSLLNTFLGRWSKPAQKKPAQEKPTLAPFKEKNEDNSDDHWAAASIIYRAWRSSLANGNTEALRKRMDAAL
jgi:hypothetical protein